MRQNVLIMNKESDFKSDIDRRELTLQAIRYMGLKTKGEIYPSTDQIMVRCPIHGQGGKDKNPSCGISLSKGLYNCFACGAHGSIESLFREVTGLDLYQTLNINNDSFSKFARHSYYDYEESREQILKLKDVNIECNLEEYSIPAYSSRLAAKYLQNRGISKEAALSMGMRYSDDITVNGTRFIKRLLIPIYENGKLISVEGRRILDTNEPKVLYPKNSTVNTLFQWDKLNKDEPVFATEGLMDCAQFRNNSKFQNSTAIFGANLTRRQGELIKQLKQFTYCADRDLAGNQTIEKLKQYQNGNIYILLPPKQINGQPIKDLGDCGKLGITVEDLIEKNWLSHIKYLE